MGSETKTETGQKKNNEKEKKTEKKKKNYIMLILLIFLSFIIMLLAIFIALKLRENNYNEIDNNTEKNKGIIEIIKTDKNDKITIKKNIFNNVIQFVSCLGNTGSGKSTFSSYYYKYLYHVKNNYFEISEQSTSFTKGIWMISDEERNKIPYYLLKDILDVEGFQVDESKSWNYAMIIAFLSTELIIFNRSERYDEIGKIIGTIQIGLNAKIKNTNNIKSNIYTNN